MPHTVCKAEISMVPTGFFAAYTATELARVEKRFNYHPERHNAIFYDAVAENLVNGEYIPFPDGANQDLRPSSHCFTFEQVRFMVMLPQPYDAERRVLICPATEVDEKIIARAAHIYAEMFHTEYGRFYSGAIKQSKSRKVR